MTKTILIVWHGALFPSYRKPFGILQEHYGWDVHLLATSSWKKALPARTEFERSPEEIISLHVQRSVMNFHGALYFHPSFPLLFRQIEPDILFVIEEPFSLSAWFSVYWSKRSVPQVPVILYSYQDINKTYPPPFRWMERFVLKHADRILVSNRSGGAVLERKGYTNIWDVLPSAVNLERFHYKEPRHQGYFFTLGYVGRLAPYHQFWARNISHRNGSPEARPPMIFSEPETRVSRELAGFAAY